MTLAHLLRRTVIGTAMLLMMMAIAPSVYAQGAPISGTAQVSVTGGSVTVGSTVQVELKVNLTGVTGVAPDTSSTPAVLGAYVIGVTFDSTRLQFISASGGTSPKFAGDPTVNVSSGKVTLSAVQSSATAPTGLVGVAMLTFKGIAAGSAGLQPSAESLSSAYQPPSSGPASIASSGNSNSITVSAANRPPVLTAPATQSSAEGQSVSLQVNATDPDGDPLSIGASNLPQGLSIASNGLITGVVGFSAAAGSPYTVQLSVSDGRGGTDAKSFTWTVTNTNRPPVITSPANQSSAEGASVSLQLTATDPDSDPLSWTGSGLPNGLSISSGGLISGTVSSSASGSSPYTVQVTVKDSSNATNSKSFTWTVSKTNRLPVLASPGNQSGVEGSSVSLQLSASDPDGDQLGWSATGLPTGLSLDGSGRVSGTLAANSSASSPFSVKVTVDDNKGGKDSKSFIWTVSRSCSTPDAPTSDSPASANSGELYAVNWSAIAGASGYQVQESSSPSFTSASTVTLPSSARSTKFSHFVSTEVTYYYRVRAQNKSTGCDVDGPYSTTVATSIKASTGGELPGIVANPQPMDGASNVSVPVTLTWTAASGALSYEVYFGVDSNPPLVTQTATPLSTVSAQSATKYFWRVVAVNAAGKTSGPVWSFTTSGSVSCNAPPTPVLGGPAAASSGSLFQLSWTPSSGATEYVVEESSDSGFVAITFTTAVSSQSTNTGISRTVGQPTRFYYRVRARINRTGCDLSSAPSNTLTVTVAPGPVSGIDLRVIPVVASTPGAFGSFFRTAVQLHNPSSSSATSGRIVFHPQGASGSADDPFLPYSLQPRETLYIPDVLVAMGRAGIGGADLVIESGAVPLTAIRIFDDGGASGTTGMNEPVFRADEALQPGQSVLLIAPPDLSLTRFNIGIRSLGDGLTFDVAVLDERGETVGAVTRSFAGTFFVQMSAKDLLGAEPPPSASIILTVRSGSGIVYGSSTDNVTQDPSMQLPQLLSSN